MFCILLEVKKGEIVIEYVNHSGRIGQGDITSLLT